MKFKQFIKEAAVGEPPRYDDHGINESVDLFLKYCKDAMWMIEGTKRLYRGDRHIKPSFEVLSVDPTLTERKSQNTSNHYTILLDNLPSWKDYPKRSRSFICSSDFDYADDFSGGAGPFYIIPFDNVKIGVCPTYDIWEVPVFDSSKSLGVIPNLLDDAGISTSDLSWSTFIKFDKNASEEPDFYEEQLIYACRNYRLPEELAQRLATSFINTLNDELDPNKLGFEYHTTKTLKSSIDGNHEVWIGGKVLMIPSLIWNDFKEKLLERVNEK